MLGCDYSEILELRGSLSPTFVHALEATPGFLEIFLYMDYV